jgi:hypothetical protein
VKGDRLLFFASRTWSELIALAEFGGVIGHDGGDTRYNVHFLTGVVEEPLPREELEDDPVLCDAVFLKSGPAQSVTSLSPEQGRRLYQLLCRRNPAVSGTWPDIDEGFVLREADSGPYARAEGLDDIDAPALEGRPQLVEHLRHERNRAVVQKKKNFVLRKTGALKCEVCGFDFRSRYGLVGREFCEVHHNNPLAATESEVETHLDDLAIVCSNCHRMLHWLDTTTMSVATLRGRLRRFQTAG